MVSDFLKATVLGTALAITGCAWPGYRLPAQPNKEIHEALEHPHRELEDPYGYLKYLEDREFVVKNEIFDAYARTVDKRPEWLGQPVGGYLSENYLDTKAEVKEFRKRLAKLGLSQDEIRFYEVPFTSTDLIIFRESILKEEDYFLKVLAHERFHKEIKRLSNKEYQVMRQAAQEIMSRKDEDGRYPFSEKWYPGKRVSGLYLATAQTNWEEFYTFLAQGEFEPLAEDLLKGYYPEAYEIFERLKSSTEPKAMDPKMAPCRGPCSE